MALGLLARQTTSHDAYSVHQSMIVEDTWGMMVWLTKYIEQNKHDWERRRQEPPENDLEKWTRMDEEEMVKILQESEAKEAARKETLHEKAARRKSNWRVWRQSGTKEEILEDDRRDSDKERMEDYAERNRETTRRRKEWLEEK